MKVSEGFLSNMNMVPLVKYIRADSVPTGAGDISRSERRLKDDTGPVELTVT